MYPSPSMTIAVHSPFWQRAKGREVWITKREYALVAAVQGGWTGNQRALARALGYSLAGLNEALATLSKVGILARSTTRGRLGRTRLRIQAGVHVIRNVRSLVERISTSISKTTYLGPNISNPRTGRERQSAAAPVRVADPDEDWLREWAV